MVQKKKHRKRINKIREEKAKKQEAAEIDFDTSAYHVYNNFNLPYPCLSFDILKSNNSTNPDLNYPLSVDLIAGAQTPSNVEINYLYVANIANIHPLTQEKEEEEDDENEDEEQDDPLKEPRLSTLRVPIKGCVNRIRAVKIAGKTFSATWTDKAKVHIHDLTTPVQAVSDLKLIKTYLAQKIENKPVFTFGGHLAEGYAIDWSPTKAGVLASGDCKKNIHVWTPQSSNNWNINQQPLVGHTDSVEDIKWSPIESELLSSCSVDKSIRIWDLRASVDSKNVMSVTEAHSSDINVIDWNKLNTNLLVSGGDDGVVKIWDIRHMKRNQDATPVANFSYHSKAITSVEWNPNDETVIAVSSEDDRLTIWDLAVEKDEEEEMNEVKIDEETKSNHEEDMEQDDAEDEDEDDEDDETEDDEDDNDEMEDDNGVNEIDTVPEQMLFLHQGQNEIKELHWHPYIPGLILSSALTGVNIIKTISA